MNGAAAAQGAAPARLAGGARLRAHRDRRVLADAPEIERGEVRPRTSRPRSSSSRPRRTPRRTALHQHAAAAAVAPQGGRAARRLPQRARLHVHLGRRLKAALRRLDAIAKDRPIQRPDLGLPDEGPHDEPDAEAVLHEINGYTVADRQAGRRLHGARRTTARPRAAAGSTPAATRTASTSRRGASRARSRPGSRPSGAGRGRQPAASCTTAPRPIPTASPWSERKTYVWWDDGKRKWTGLRRARLHRRPRRRRTGRRRTRTGIDTIAGDRSVHHAGRRQGLAVRAERAASTGRCRRTTSREESVVREPALRAAVQPGAHGVARGADNPYHRAVRRSALPVRAHHLSG